MNWIVDALKTATGAGRSDDLSIRTPFYHPDFPAIIMWSEKAACTVIAKWFFHHVGLLDEALAYARWIHKYENEVFKARPGYKRDCLAAIKAGKPIIKFTRNPYARAYSGYLETCNPRVLREPDHWSTQTRRSILESLTGSSADLEYAYSFVQFSNWLSTMDASKLDLHLAPQMTEFEQGLNVDVIQLENLRFGLADIETHLGLNSTKGLETVHASGHHHNKIVTEPTVASQALTIGLPIKKQSTFEFFDIAPKTISKSAAGRLLGNVFQADFKAYGYNDAT